MKTKSVSSGKVFKNQSEQEIYLAQEFFKKNYSEKRFDKYKGSISMSGDSIKYSDQSFIVVNTSKELKDIFLTGILYPSIITENTKADSLKIYNFKEIPFLNLLPTQRRFRFWLYQKRLLNPTVCFIELTNNKANSKTDSKTFLEGAILTFCMQGWIII